MKKKKLNLSGVTPDTWARTIWLIIALVSEWVVVLGLQPLPESLTSLTVEQITTYVTVAFQSVQNIVNYWKNNSLSKSGQSGDIKMWNEEGRTDKVRKYYAKHSKLKYTEPDEQADHYRGGSC